MNDAEVASVLSPTSHNGNPADRRLGSEKPSKDVFLPPPPTTATLNGDAKVASDGNGNNDDAGSVKADSEAETIIQSGREELSPQKKRTFIQHKVEHNGGKRSHTESVGTGISAASEDFKARKRKRIESDHRDDGAFDVHHSSKPSSRVSSPTPVLKREKTEDSSLVSTTRSSSLPRSDSARVIKSIENRKHTESEADDHSFGERRHRKHASHHVSSAGKSSGREERRVLSHSRHLSHDRSTSPALRSHKRVLSTSSQSASHPQKRRCPPPPLLTDRRRHSSEDRDSTASSARGSPFPVSRPRRIPSNEYSATSPAKQMPPKRQRDQNGRTRLARACAAQEVDVARSRYAAHPEELDVPDNAGNTPLQIAALEGNADIVKFLLEAGCDINTKNIDKDTPLIDAVENGHLEVVKLLLDAGANPRVGNAEGDEPYDLIPSDSENYDKLRQVLAEAKARGVQRRKSVDIGVPVLTNANVREPSRGASAASPRNSPPVFGNRHSPPVGSGRRKTVRSELTRNDLLWTRSTPGNLRDFAAKGDLAGVVNVLNILQKADAESLIAAAKGSHDEVLGILLGMGNPDPNPEPIESGNHRLGYNTPMLAAIGRGNNNVIKLLLEQRGFDPTRVDHRGRRFYEISEERKGENWEAERDMLKDAYDSYIGSSKTGKSDAKSPRKSRGISKEVKRRSQEDSVSPASSHRKVARSPESRQSHQGPQKNHKSRKDSGKDESLDRSSGKAYKKVQPQDDANSENPTTSDHDSTRSRHTKQKSSSDLKKQNELSTAATHGEEPARRRRLIAGRPPDRRRGSFMSTDSHSTRDDVAKEPTERFNHEARRVNEASPSKRSRDSASPEPPRSRGRQDRSSQASDSQIRKQRVRPESSPTPLSKELTSHTVTGKPPSPKMMSQSRTSGAVKSESEKLSNMRQEKGAKNILESNMATVSAQEQRHHLEPKIGSDGTLAATGVFGVKQPGNLKESHGTKETEQKLGSKETEKVRAGVASINVKDNKPTNESGETKTAEDLAQAKRVSQEAADEEARKQKEIDEHRAQKAEDARWSRVEKEVYRQLRERKEQEVQEQRRRAALPHRLRVAANLIGSNNSKAKSLPWLKRLTPVFYTIQAAELDHEGDVSMEDERWVINYQVAPLLASNDLQLSQYPSWERRAATPDHRFSLWRVTRSMLAYSEELATLDAKKYWEANNRRIEEMKPIFYSMEHVFWVKLSDFLDVVPHLPHLRGLDLRLTRMALQIMPASEAAFCKTVYEQQGTSNSMNSKTSLANGIKPDDATPR